MTARKSRFLGRIASMLLGLLLLGACSAKDKTMTLGITGYNYTSEGVQEYYVNDSRGSNLPMYGGGGSTSCCASLPTHWTPEVTVKVGVNIGHYTRPLREIDGLTSEEAENCCFARRIFEKTVPVQPYKDSAGGDVQVFFLPNDEIKVWVSALDVGHKDHPSGMQPPRKPADGTVNK